MATPVSPEFWLRGPVEGVQPALMPAAHAFLQTLEDVERATADLSNEQLWLSPGGATSIGFHVMHLSGSTDRLLTYARGEMLTDAQKAAARAESNPPHADVASLVADLRRSFEAAMAQLRATAPDSIFDARPVGRAGLPTNVLGLLFHAAEHSQRHAGQVVTTARIVRSLT
jgi:DinB superfamily